MPAVGEDRPDQETLLLANRLAKNGSGKQTLSVGRSERQRRNQCLYIFPVDENLGLAKNWTR